MGELKEEQRPDSLSPITVETGGIDEEVTAMNKGNRGKMIAVLVGLLLIGSGSVLGLNVMDRTSGYRDAGKALSSVKKTGFDGFWTCALPGVDLREIKSNADLVGRIQIQERGKAGALVYARQVRDRCIDTLLGIETKLDAKLFPSDLGRHINAMKAATSKMREAWQEYITYLTNSGSDFDEAKSTFYETRIAEGWYGFLKGYVELNGALRAKLK
jgi:hypothetical protein